MTMLEKIGAVVIVVAVIAVVGMMSWSLLRPSKVPPRETVTEWKTTQHHDRDGHQAAVYAQMLGVPAHHVQVFDGRRLRAFDEFPAPTPERERSWPPGPTEDTRICFRRFLAGGPDYYHQEG